MSFPISPDASWYFVNTDATSLGGESPHDAWLEYGMAFTGGGREYGEKLSRLSTGDAVLAWANGEGVVAVGRVVAPWDEIAHDDPLVYVEPYADTEYRLVVDWFLDLRDGPMTPADIGGNPRSAVQRIDKLLKRVQQHVHRRYDARRTG